MPRAALQALQFLIVLLDPETEKKGLAPNPPEFAHRGLSRSEQRSSPARGYKFVGVFVPTWLVLPRCKTANFRLTQMGLCKFVWV